MEIGFKKIVCNLLGITARSYSNWSKEKRPIISFFEKNYLTKNDLEEYINTGKIEKLELIKNYSVEELKNKLSTQQIIYDDDYLVKDLTFKFLIFNKNSPLIVLRKIFENLDHVNIKKEELLKIINDYQIKLLDFKTKKDKKNAVFFIDKLLTDYEVNLLVKYKKEIFTSFYDIEDTKID